MGEKVEVKRTNIITKSTEQSKSFLLEPKEDEPPSYSSYYLYKAETDFQKEFKNRFFTHISPAMWNDWRWQIKERIRSQ